MILEGLERRRLLSFDLTSFGPSGLDAPITPGGTATLTLPIVNFGTDLVIQPFVVESKLIPSPEYGPQNTDFYDPNAIELKMDTVTNNIPVGPSGFPYATTLNFPADLAPGRWTLVVAIDSTLQVNESNESNNYFSFGFTRVYPADGVLTFNGTDGNDDFEVAEISQAAGVTTYSLNINNEGAQIFSSANVTQLNLNGLGGDDVMVVSHFVPGVVIDGGDGNDRIVGGDGNDFLIGGAGKDVIYGGAGNDRINGNGGNDKLFGEAGADRIYGYAGNDYIDGGSSGDRLEGGAGMDTILGESGNDRFFTLDGQIDQLFGGTGKDSAVHDSFDVLSSIES